MSFFTRRFRTRFCLSLVFLSYANCPGHLPHVPTQDFESGSAGTSATSSSRDLLIDIINVGQGDATLILGPRTSGRRTALLIDAGRLDPDGGAIVSRVLQNRNVTALDYAVLTHFDGDHMGGFVTALESTSVLWDAACVPGLYFPTRSVIDLGESDKTTDSVLEYLSCRNANLGELDVDHIVVGTPANANIGHEISLGGGYSATIVAGNGYVLDQDERVANVDTDNEKSIAVLVSGPDNFHFLVTGDLTGQAHGDQDALVETALGQALETRGIDLSLLRVGHHGSASSSTPDFLQSLAAEVALISVGDNPYGHPDCDVLDDLIRYVGFVLQTNAGNTENCETAEEVVVADGDILITVEDGEYTIETSDAVYACSTRQGCE